MSETQSQSFEVIAKEIVIAIIQKSSKNTEGLLDFACEAYPRIYETIVETYNKPR